MQLGVSKYLLTPKLLKFSKLLHMRKLINIQLKLFSLIIFFISCESEKSTFDFKYKLNIREAINLKETHFNLSNIADTIEYIALETNESCLLLGISYLHMNSNYIFVSDYKKLYQFNNNGAFVRQIGRIGKGPEEHSGRIRFAVNEYNNEIYVSSYPNKILVFDAISGIYKRSFKVKFTIAKIEILAKDRLIIFPIEVNPRRNSSKLRDEVYIVDPFGKIKGSIADKKREYNNNNNVLGSIHLYKYYEKLHFMGTYKDALYSLDSKFEKHGYLKLEMKNKVQWEELIIEPNIDNKLDEYLTVYRISENTNYFFLKIRNGIVMGEEKKIENLVYDKINQRFFKTNGILNDLDEVADFWPRFIFDDKLIDCFNSNDLIEIMKNKSTENLNSNGLKNIIQKIDIGSNPIIAIAQKAKKK